MKDKQFWQNAANKAIRTFAQTLIGAIGASYIISDVDWQVAFSGSLLAAILSVLTTIAAPMKEPDIS